MTTEHIAFLLRAKRATYAGKGPESPSSRPATHDLAYQEGSLLYIDSYLGGSYFAGEEALWEDGQPVWSMNYVGRVIGDPFSGDFLKAALLHVPQEKPYRGPEFYQEGDYAYSCRSEGSFDWFEGYESITYQGICIYEAHSWRVCPLTPSSGQSGVFSCRFYTNIHSSSCHHPQNVV